MKEKLRNIDYGAIDNLDFLEEFEQIVNDCKRNREGMNEQEAREVAFNQMQVNRQEEIKILLKAILDK